MGWSSFKCLKLFAILLSQVKDHNGYDVMWCNYFVPSRIYLRYI